MTAKEMHSTSRRELGRGEFSITYLCTDKETDEMLACKSISKRKLKTAIDIEVVRQEAAIMNNLPQHPNIVTLKATYEDEHAVHLVTELCEGGEVFNRIVARGHYNERVAAAVTRTIVEFVQMCHKNGVMHRDFKPENFLFANKKENSALKAIDFSLSVLFKPSWTHSQGVYRSSFRQGAYERHEWILTEFGKAGMDSNSVWLSFCADVFIDKSSWHSPQYIACKKITKSNLPL